MHLAKIVEFCVGVLATVPLAISTAYAGMPDPALEFSPRRMHSVELPLRNADFREGSAVPLYWSVVGPASSVALGEGPVGQPAAWLDASGAETEIGQDIPVTGGTEDAGALSVSAWVWSDTPAAAEIALSGGSSGQAISAFHSGRAGWEYLTVVLPFGRAPNTIRVALKAQRGHVRFARVSALATFDDRFTKTLPDGCAPLRERVTYEKHARVRIVVVGGSTVNGFVAADKRASFPYVLQLKLESIFPGKFEVINFGICAWHLPPQLVTLDKTFDMNLWCDGAPWCHQAEPFSHRNALDGRHDADDNAPTIRELRPDVIVFAGMWNDVWRTLKYPVVGVPPIPAEVNRIGGEPASVVYAQAALRYLDHPTKRNLARADALMRAANKPLEDRAAGLTFDRYDQLRDSAAFQAIIENARRKLAYLGGEFIRRGKRYGEVWTLVLPGRFGDAFEEAGHRMTSAGMLAPDQVDKFLMNGYIDAITERIQSAELTRVSTLLGALTLDLSCTYHRDYGRLGLSEQFALGYFLENLEDNVHFMYRGNEWIADQIYAAFADQLAALAAAREQASGDLRGVR